MRSDFMEYPVSNLNPEQLKLIQLLEKELGEKYILIAYDKTNTQ